MLAMWVKVRVKPGGTRALLKAIESTPSVPSGTSRAACASMYLPGRAGPERLLLYEAYRDEAALEAASRGTHYAVWRAAADTLDGPPQATRCQTVFPARPTTGPNK